MRRLWRLKSERWLIAKPMNTLKVMIRGWGTSNRLRLKVTPEIPRQTSHATINFDCSSSHQLCVERWLMTCFKTWWTDYSPCSMKGSDCNIFSVFPGTFGGPPTFQGVSLYMDIFLTTALSTLCEIWPDASLNISARFLVTFERIAKFSFLLACFACPRLYLRKENDIMMKYAFRFPIGLGFQTADGTCPLELHKGLPTTSLSQTTTILIAWETIHINPHGRSQVGQWGDCSQFGWRYVSKIQLTCLWRFLDSSEFSSRI